MIFLVNIYFILSAKGLSMVQFDRGKSVAFVLGSFYPAQEGGPDNTIYWLGKALVKSNFDVTVFSTSKGINNSAMINIWNSLDGINVCYFSYFISHYFSIGLLISFWRKVRQYDIVHLTSIYYPLSMICALICIIRRVDFSISPRGELDRGASQYSSKLKMLYRSISIPILSKSKYCIATSEQEKSDLFSVFGKNKEVRLLINYLDEYSFGHGTDKYKSCSGYMLYLGRIHPKKNIESLISAFKMLPKDLTDVHPLYIAGTGNQSYVHELKCLSAGYNIKFIGKVTGLDKLSLYKNASLFILPTHGENYGNVVAESLAQGTPVICSIYAPWKGLVVYECGYFIDNKPEDILNSIVEFFSLSDEEKCIMGERALCFAKSKLSTNGNEREIANVFF